MTFFDSFAKSQPDTGLGRTIKVLQGLRGVSSAFAEGFARDPEIRASRKKARIDRETREEIQENKRQKSGIERLRFMGKLAVAGFISKGLPVPNVFAQIGKKIALNIGGDLGEEEGQIFLSQISQPPPGQEPATGFERDPDNPGAFRRIVGGSQDVDVLAASAESRAAGTAAGTPEVPLSRIAGEAEARARGTAAGTPAGISDRSTDLVDFTLDAQGREIATLKNEATNSVRGVVANAFEGTYDPISQKFIGLDKESAARALAVQSEAEELLRTQQELTVGSAVRRALRELKARGQLGGDEQIALEEARAAIKRGAPRDQIEKALKELGFDPSKL